MIHVDTNKGRFKFYTKVINQKCYCILSPIDEREVKAKNIKEFIENEEVRKSYADKFIFIKICNTFVNWKMVLNSMVRNYIGYETDGES